MANLAKHVPNQNGTAKAWANLNGTGTIAERGSFNVSGYIDNGTGNYTFTIANDMANANYAPSVSVVVSVGGQTRDIGVSAAPVAGSFGAYTYRDNGGSAVFEDQASIFAKAFGDLA